MSISSKKELRSSCREFRLQLPSNDGRAAAQLLTAPEIRAASCIAAYWSIGREPATHELLEALRFGTQILLPVVERDWNLNWVAWNGRPLIPKQMANGVTLLEPEGKPLGIDHIFQASVIITPGLRGNYSGARLGQGVGCYDRAFSLADPKAWRVLLLHDEELSTDQILEDEHDQRVNAIATPSQLIRCS